MSERSYCLGIDEVRKFLPHRSPFLLVDRILEIQVSVSPTSSAPQDKVGIKVVGLKNISYNEPYFQGHFPSYSIVPGVLLIESMAQVASFSLYPHMSQDPDRLSRDFQCILVGVDGARFRKPVVPGDTVRIETVVTKCRGKLWAFKCQAWVDGQLVAEADILANLLANDSLEVK